MRNDFLPSFGLVGTGRFGSILGNSLNKLGCLLWKVDSNSDFTLFEMPDWVFIATPNVIHFEQAVYFLSRGANVFIEKPAVLNPDSLLELIEIANQNKCLLYISDVFLFDISLENLSYSANSNSFFWQKKIDNQKTSIIDRLAYHHLYLIYERINKTNPNMIINNINFYNNFEIDLSLRVDKIDFNLSYKVDKSDISKHIIFGSSIKSKKDSVFLMLQAVIEESVDFQKNQVRSLWVLKCIEKIKKNCYKNINVVGAGIFGCTAAIELAKRGHVVNLYEQHSEIFSESSSINQYRVHKGYHYPRSIETAMNCKDSSIAFVKAFRQAIVSKKLNIEHYYAIAKKNSLTSPSQYIEFLNTVGLEYEIVPNLPNTSLTIKVNENVFDPSLLKEIINKRLKSSNVNINLGYEVNSNRFNDLDSSVIATYSRLNDWVEEQELFQFELCEKPVFKLPECYQNKSIVIMDGPFMCIDPYGESGNHVMGNVVHAIHSSNVGVSPIIPSGYKELLNNGLIKNPSKTNVSAFIESAFPFFPEIREAIHIGSMFTFRTVKPNLEKTDARPTLVSLTKPNMVSLFSGKICTCLNAAKEAADIIELKS